MVVFSCVPLHKVFFFLHWSRN